MDGGGAGPSAKERPYRNEKPKQKMTTYTFTPNPNDQSVNWNDPSVWVGGVVPNSPDADVIIPETTVIATGQSYPSNITVSGAVSANSISLTANFLEVGDTLSVAN